MAKSPDAFRTISEVADWLGVEAHVLRFWETKFSQVKPVKRAGGRRYYRPADMALLGGIRRLLHDEGMTIRGVQKVLREKGIGHVAGMSPELRLDDVEPKPAPQPARRVPPETIADDAAPSDTPDRHEADTPTLPFRLPPAAPAETPPGPAKSAANGDGALRPEAGAEAAEAGTTRLQGAAKVDPVAAAELLARARALVERLRNTPE